MFPWKLIHFYIGRCNIPSICVSSGVFWLDGYLLCKEENTISAIKLVLLRDSYSIIISSTSYMWELVFYSSVENICMRHSITNKGEAHKAGLVNPGKMMVTCVLEIYFACINDILIMFCVCSEGVVFYIFHFMNQCTSRKNKHILLAINTCPCIYLTGFLFSLLKNHLQNIKKNSFNRR
jgi:hypothetical protein